jgi:hypothetical protein
VKKHVTEAEVGKRLLLKVSRSRYCSDSTVTEYRLLEVAPSGNWVKLRDLNGRQFWVAYADVGFVEELRDLRAERMAERATLR